MTNYNKCVIIKTNKKLEKLYANKKNAARQRQYDR